MGDGSRIEANATIVDGVYVADGFKKKIEMSESMSELMSELERTRMQTILIYLETNKEIKSSIAAELLDVEIKAARRLLLTHAVRVDIMQWDNTLCVLKREGLEWI